jgi:integrase
MRNPKSFVIVLRRRYRVYFNPQGGGWYAAFSSERGRERVSLGVNTRPQAESAVRVLDTPPAETPRPGRVLWADVQSGFLAHKKMVGRAPGTIIRCRSSLDAVQRYFNSKGIKYADEVTLLVLEGYLQYRTEVEKRDPITAYTDQIVMKGALKWGVRPSRGLIRTNPGLDWETPKPPKPKKPMYTPDEVKAMENGVREWLRPIVTTLAWTGMRIGELINLRWKDVDLEHRVIRVQIQEDWKPKGKRDRTIPLHPKVEAVIRKQPLGERVFCGPYGGRLKETYCLECLKFDQQDMGLRANDLHGFRRFFATTMMQAGANTETVRQWGGWRTLDTMMRYLADVNVKDSVAAMDKVAATLAGG